MVIMAQWDATEACGSSRPSGSPPPRWCPANFIRILEADWSAYDRSSVRKVLHAAAPCPVPVKRRIIDVFPPDTVWEYYGRQRGHGLGHLPRRVAGQAGQRGPALSRACRCGSWTRTAPSCPPARWGRSTSRPSPASASATTTPPTRPTPAWRGDYFTVGDMGWLGRGRLPVPGRPAHRPHHQRRGQHLPGRGGDGPGRGRRRGRRGGHRPARRAHGPEGARRGGAAPRRRPRRRGAARPRLAGRLADYKRPRTVEFVDELPREPNGKVLKTQTARRADGTGHRRWPGRGLTMTDAATRPEVRGEPRLLIDGKLVEASSGASFDNIDPATEEVARGHRRRHRRRHGRGHRRGAARLRRHRLVHRPRAAPALPGAAPRRARGPQGGAARRRRWPRWAAPCRSPTSIRSTCPSTTWPTGSTSPSGTSTSTGCPSATSSASPSAG